MKVTIRNGARVCVLDAAELRAIDKAVKALRLFASESSDETAKSAADAVEKFLASKRNERHLASEEITAVA